MAAYQSPVRRFSADFLSDKENTPNKEVNRLKSLLKTQTRVADTSTNSDADDCAIHQKDRDDKVIVKLKDGTMIKLCKSCATSKSIGDNCKKPTTRQRKPRTKADKETKASDKKTTNKNARLENSVENETIVSKPKATKSARTTKNKANTTASKALIEKNINVHEQQVDANQEANQAVKKTAAKPKRATKKAQEPEDTTKTQDEINNTANENLSITTSANITTDESLHETQDTSVNDNGNLEKPVKKTRQRKGKKNSENVDKGQDQLNDKLENDNTIDNNNSQFRDDHNKSDRINNTLETSTKAKRGKRNNVSTLQKQGKLNNSVEKVNTNLIKETEEPSGSTVAGQINNISTDDCSFHDMESHSTSLEDNHHGNMSIHQNETIKNNQPTQGNVQASDNHHKSDTTNNIAEENVTKRHGEKKNKKETTDGKKKVINDYIKKDPAKQPGNSKIEERNDNVSTDDPSFNNMQVHSTSLEDNIHKDETLKINQLMLQSSFVSVKKEPVDDAESSVKNQANMFESPKKPAKYQLVVKAPLESPKKKCKSKKMEQSGAEASCSFKKGKAEEKETLKESCKLQKKKSSQSKKKMDRKSRTVVKVAKAMEKMSKYYAKYKLGKPITESDLSTTESESSSSECSSSCSCYSETSSGDDCRCWNCLMRDSSDDSSSTETSDDESDESDTSDSLSSSGTCKCENNKRRACKRYSLRRH
ncbi:hypothetical protein TSAR_010734 [Trichomalopsis sarcophagae]|uniref:Uncharacterized protein n=1 Tax=Trichomalopsis sarcophagae TaxID=543379 RepID=A0A232EZ67_9HYME|nr:hypothetical protein TSAR_010734 [Trichomalopsis sarcophagae]